jgi:hypothetical protein
VGDAGDVHVDPVAPERDALRQQMLALPLPYGQAAVGADYAPPGSVVGVLLGRQEAGREPRRAGRNVAVGADEALRDLPNRVDDLQVPVVVDQGFLARPAPRCVS